MTLRTTTRRSILALGGALAGCSPVQVLNSFAPQRLDATDVPYADGPAHKLDIYLPQTPGPWPVAVFIYGGGWDSGNRAMYSFVGGSLAAGGVATVIPQYRLYPGVRYPAFLQDCAQAVRWTRDTIGEFGPATGPLYLIGHSAGAYNAAMLALDPQWLGAVGMDRRALRGVIGIAGPYDFLPLDSAELMAIFGPPDQLPQTQPINHVDGHAPPMLLLAGTADGTVKPGNTTRLAARILAAGGAVQSRLYAGVDHYTIIGALGTPLRFLAPTRRDCLAFMGRASASPAAGPPAGA